MKICHPCLIHFVQNTLFIHPGASFLGCRILSRRICVSGSTRSREITSTAVAISTKRYATTSKTTLSFRCRVLCSFWGSCESLPPLPNVPGPVLPHIPLGWRAPFYNEQHISQPPSFSFPTDCFISFFWTLWRSRATWKSKCSFPISSEWAYTLHNPFVPAGPTAAALAMQRPAGFVEEVQPEDLTPRARPIVGTFQDVNLTSEVVAFEEQVEEEEDEDFEGEIQPRGRPIPARPREGVIYIDSGDEECSVTFYRTYGAKRKKCQRIGYTTRQHLRWYKTAPERFDWVLVLGTQRYRVSKTFLLYSILRSSESSVYRGPPRIEGEVAG
jgi:hypothetical protein